MITVSVNGQNDLVITGQMAVGDKVANKCCPGFDWGVVLIFPDDSPEDVSLWGVCSNPDCTKYDRSIGPTDYYRGVSRVFVGDLAEWILENQEKGEPSNT